LKIKVQINIGHILISCEFILTLSSITKIQAIIPSNGEALVTPATHITLSDIEEENALSNEPDIFSVTDSISSLSLKEQPSHQPIAGLEKAYDALYEIIRYPFLYPDLFQKMRIECPKGNCLRNCKRSLI
jgi:ATP-dependent 26S proteasome regulatory subunit